MPDMTFSSFWPVCSATSRAMRSRLSLISFACLAEDEDEARLERQLLLDAAGALALRRLLLLGGLLFAGCAVTVGGVHAVLRFGVDYLKIAVCSRSRATSGTTRRPRRTPCRR